jgi:hypothetical protein
MVIVGEWLEGLDGEIRPVIYVHVLGKDGAKIGVRFLIDSGADIAALGSALLHRLQLPHQPAPPGMALRGISGDSDFVVVSTTLQFPRAGGGHASIHGQFAAFTDPAVAELNVLGRNLLDNFHVILSRPRNEVLLVSGNHTYSVHPV